MPNFCLSVGTLVYRRVGNGNNCLWERLPVGMLLLVNYSENICLQEPLFVGILLRVMLVFGHACLWEHFLCEHLTVGMLVCGNSSDGYAFQWKQLSVGNPLRESSEIFVGMLVCGNACLWERLSVGILVCGSACLSGNTCLWACLSVGMPVCGNACQWECLSVGMLFVGTLVCGNACL